MKADTLLVGTDFSDESIRAAKHAVDFVSGFDYKIELVHIADPKHPAAGDKTKSPEEKIEELARRIRRDCSMEVETEIHAGSPGRTLARLSREEKYAIVSVGYSGHSGLLSRIGSVASQTVRLVDKPILVMVPNHHTEGPIIGCIDFSEQTEKVNYWAHSLAEIRETEPVFVHVAVPFEVLVAGTPHTGGMGIAETVLSRFGGSEEGYLTRLEASVRHRLGIGMNGEVPILLSTRPSKAIGEFAEKRNAAFTIVGRHGHNTLGARIIGSTAEHIIAQSHCSTLVLP